MGVLFIIFAVSMAAATFIENDYGSPAAYSFVYDALWFELILLLLAANLAGQMIIFKLFRKSKLTIFLFHFSFILMIAGAAITRYFGWEGSIHIREGEEMNICYSGENYLSYTVTQKNGQILAQGSDEYNMTSVSADNYKKDLEFDGKDYQIVLARILPNASEAITEDPEGEPVISFIVSGNSRRENMVFRSGEILTFNGMSIGLNPEAETDITIRSDSSSFFLESKLPLGIMSMMTQETEIIGTGRPVELEKMQILSVNDTRIVPQEMSLKGALRPVSFESSAGETGKNAFIFHLFSEDETAATLYLWDRESENSASGSVAFDGKILEITYGPGDLQLPFSLKLNDFVLERYPGSNSPSGYKSEVTLIDREKGIEEPYQIYMNNILKHRGFRFYQSSYDPDEKGTILSVNSDMPGMLVTYTGYGFLILFIILSLVNRKSVFYTVNPGYWSSPLRKTVPLILLLFVLSGTGSLNAQKLVPDRNSAGEFGKVLVQDQKGRTKPLFTLSNDILRKVTRENSFEGLTSMQVFLGLYLDFDNWKEVPLIRVTNKELQKTLGLRVNFASFTDMVDLEGRGTYKLSEMVNTAYARSPGERSKLDKEIMKVDERVNIVYLIYTGGFLKIFPLRDGTDNWGSPQEALKNAVSKEDSVYLQNIMQMYAQSLQANDPVTARRVSASVGEYQEKFAGYELPGKGKTKAEILYYKLMIFERLFPYYATTGLIMLIGLIIMVIRGRKEVPLFVKVLSYLLFAGFLFHTFGLGLRWYISGHSPMSNGYESMIFISWVTLLAGFFFSKKSPFALSATAVLASMTLMVAHLSFMDPEITNLVPVLQSYWLTLHVSVITGSYGFLGLGAILAIITMVLLLKNL